MTIKEEITLLRQGTIPIIATLQEAERLIVKYGWNRDNVSSRVRVVHKVSDCIGLDGGLGILMGSGSNWPSVIQEFGKRGIKLLHENLQGISGATKSESEKVPAISGAMDCDYKNGVAPGWKVGRVGSSCTQ